MILLTLLMINSLPISASVGVILSENAKAAGLFGNIYEGSVNFYPWGMNRVYFGITTDVLYKRSNPFANDYFENPDLYLRLISIGAGPAVIVHLHNKIGLGMHFRLNNVGITYPESGINSSIDYKTIYHWALGFEFFTYFELFTIKKIDLGGEIGLQFIRYGREYHYYSGEDYKLFDDLTVSGFYLKIMLARW